MRTRTESSAVFIDPSPVSLSRMTDEQLESQKGGSVVVVIIIACGGRLGAATVVTVGGAIIAIAD